ncbi:MAG: UvrD-helicase domain-containing protein [Cytophagales bacterium]|nr:UvrD-helicase domain-containing protein [Cytophagales bacterium]
MNDLQQTTPAAFAINGQAVDGKTFTDVACNPERSIAVEACAGAGKTWMLIERMIRALQAGAQADEILAITFTKKAAGEMRGRLHERLEQPDVQDLRTRLLASGRTVHITNFHAWFAQLLKAAPLSVLKDVGLPLAYELLEDDQLLLPELRLAFYAQVLANPVLKADFAVLIEELGRSKTDDALVSLLAKRTEFELTDERGLLETSVLDAQEKPVDIAQLTLVAKRLGTYKGKKQITAATDLEMALSKLDWDGILLALLTAKNTPRSLESKDMQDEDRALLAATQNDLLEMLSVQHQHACWLYQQRMVRVGRAWLACFAKLKRQRGLVDMADLERVAMRLLSDPAYSGAVQERLDMKLRHVMVDEFQDTSPLQWQAMHAWLASYAGSGGGLSRPSLFIVGDPKQSIYRFRNAEPRVFAAAQVFMRETFDAALLTCDHTRRCAAAVVQVVNAALLAAQQANEYVGFRPHTTGSAETGAALALPLIEREASALSVRPELVEGQGFDKPSPSGEISTSNMTWRDSLAVPREDAEKGLKEREADQAARWIVANAGVQSVLVLSRTHEPLSLIQQALQRYGVAATKLEKNDLADVPAVQDVLALLNFLLSPQSDIDLARALKSPVFAWTDAQLMALRAQQLACLPEKKSWFELLPEATQALFKRWQAWLNRLPPHDALQAIYDDGDILNRYQLAMPSAVRLASHAALEALLWAALQIEGGRFLDAYSFVRAMRAKVQTIKAPTLGGATGEAESAAVQLLTVHGAKGLEADVVLLLSSDPPKRGSESMTTLIDWQPEHSAPQKFVFLQSEAHPPPCAEALLAADVAARELEELNALYVAATRAKQTLVLSATKARFEHSKSVWNRLNKLCTPVDAPEAARVGWAQQAPPAKVLNEVASLPAAQLTLPETSAALAFDATTDAAQSGKALHRLLQWCSLEAGALAAVALEFSLSQQQLSSVQESAHLILSGEAAWLWDESQIDWQANEYELVHAGQVLRIDRLVRHRGTQTWWVIDFKSSMQPERSAALRAQLVNYAQAVSHVLSVPSDQIQAAFVTGEGVLISLPN